MYLNFQSGFLTNRSDSFLWIPVVTAVGGIIGFAKTGSAKSLIAGGGTALILYYVFLNLPAKPIVASIIGLGKSRLQLLSNQKRMFVISAVFTLPILFPHRNHSSINFMCN